MMLEVLRRGDCDVAAFSGYGLSIRCPQVTELDKAEQQELWNALQEAYTPLAEEDSFGQADTRLRILKCVKKKR
jgi:hypothetical protein